ncbi:MAG: hypothetical protein U9O78_03280 [Patescibacteria group bacterium]|nr:hypothetical protein [Patescibacteria group bacterium]
MKFKQNLNNFSSSFNIPLQAVYGGLVFITLLTSFFFANAAFQTNQDIRQQAQIVDHGGSCGDSLCNPEENLLSCPQDCSETDICQRSGGEWKEFPNACADSCEFAANPNLMCATVMTNSCDCGPDKCWDGEECVTNPNFSCLDYQTDFNHDCVIDYGDYYILINQLYAENPNLEQDVAKQENHNLAAGSDGKVDIWDYSLLLLEWESQN